MKQAEHEEILRRAEALGRRADVASARELGELLSRHVRFEERELFPLLERELPASRLRELGRELAAMSGERRSSTSVAQTLRPVGRGVERVAARRGLAFASIPRLYKPGCGQHPRQLDRAGPQLLPLAARQPLRGLIPLLLDGEAAEPMVAGQRGPADETACPPASRSA